MGMTREELELAVGGEPGGGGMSLWSDEMEDDADADIAALEEEIATFDLDAEYDPETGCYMSAAGVQIQGNSGLKIIFRRLPPKINEQEFLEITGLNPSDYNYFCLKNPSRYDSFDPEDRSVAFVNFVDPELANYYLERFDGFQFIDKSGNDYYSTTTRAPYQTIPRLISKIDPMEGTVLETEDFADFVRRYEHGDHMFGVLPKYEDGLEMCELYLQELEEKRKNPPQNEASPLVEYFKELRREERLTGKRLVDRKSLPRVRAARKDKRKEDRKERRDRERKEKRLRRKNKYEEENGKQLNSVSEIPEKEEADGTAKGENEISTPKESMTPAASSNSVKETKHVKKPVEEKAPFPRRGNNFPNKTSDSKSKVGPTKYGPNSYSNSKEKDAPRRPYNSDKKPQIEKSEETNRSGEPVKQINRSEEKSWRKNGNVRNQRGGWDREGGRDNRDRDNDRWERPERDKWSKDKERSSNNKKPTTGNETKTGASISNKENDKSDTSTKTETIPAIKILQKEKVTATVTEQAAKSDTIKQEKIKTDKIEEPDSGSTDKSQPKQKTIVKKIIKIKKIVPRGDQPVEEGKRERVADSGRIRAKEGGPTANAANPSRQGEKERVRRPDSQIQKPSSSSSTPARTNETVRKDSKTEIEDKDKRVRRARPDIQIYRPGSWRTKVPEKSQTAGNGNGNGNDGSSTTSKD